jgi:hypothetical protein
MALVACGLILILVRVSSAAPTLADTGKCRHGLTVLAVYTCAQQTVVAALFSALPESGSAELPVDLLYLSSLGCDALPAMVRLERQVRGTPLEKQVRIRIGKLTRLLDERLSDWRGLTPKRCYLRCYLEREYRPEPDAVETAGPQAREGGGKRERSQ